MTSTLSPVNTAPAATVRELALADAGRFARHPLFVVGVASTAVLTWVVARDRDPSPLGWTVMSAMLIGVFGFVVAHRLTTALHRSEEVIESLPSRERQRTLALCLACAVPLIAGLVCAILQVLFIEMYPPITVPADAPMTWFGDPSTSWLRVTTGFLAMGPVATLGGPLLGIAVATWAPFRGSALITSVTLVLACALPSESPTAFWRALPPWAAIVDEHAVHGTVISSRFVPGISPEWYLVYTLLLCALAVVAALLHDPHDRRPLLWAGAGLAVATVGAFALTLA